MNILLTGASRGIGAALAKSLATGKHRLILVARDKERLDQIVSECNVLAGERVAEPLVFDLLKLEVSQDDFMKSLIAKTEVLDVLINNAGLLVNKAFQELTIADSRKVFELNYFVPELLTRLCLPLLKKSKAASIVNVSSMGGVQGSAKFPGLSSYSASKGAIATLTECLAEEFSNLNIKVNALAFGAVQTDMLEEAFPGYTANTSPEEMGAFFSWFVEEGWKRFNGKILPVTESTP